MLSALSIENVVLIEKLVTEFEQGLCALTGETGAGKSILLDALGLALGSRSEARLVRKGTKKASVTASFDLIPSHSALNLLKESDIDCAGSQLILRRSVTSDGRSKAYINDQPVSVALLKQVGETLVEIHGQNDTRGLLDPANHRAMLDEYAGIKGGITTLWDDWSIQRTELDALRRNANKSHEEEEYLRQSLEDLDSLAAEQGEGETLATLRESLIHREKVMEALNTAYHDLTAENDPVSSAWGTLERVADKIGAQGQGVINALDRATAEIQEAITLIQTLSSDLEHSAHNLESIDDRLHELQAQARKHNCTIDKLAEKREELAAQLGLIEHADDLLADKIKAVEKARALYIKEAEELSLKRVNAAKNLDKLVQKELPPLKLERAQFLTHIEQMEEENWNAHGMDRVRFLVATNPGAEPGPLGKIASGGEMSRFMLALKVVMAGKQQGQSLIFDEVDAGIGGSTADAVGERLALLAKKHQVMVVTHSPQVAARAAHHWVIAKGGTKDVKTNVIALPTAAARREEIARMLAGASVTDEARAAADKLLESQA